MFIYIIIRTVDQRPKLYALRTTWDDVFEPRILYDLDIKVNISEFHIHYRMIVKMIIAMIYCYLCWLSDQNYWLQLASEGEPDEGHPR